MATEAQLIEALRRADAAGDAPAAKAIANRIQSMREAVQRTQAKAPRGGKPMASTISDRVRPQSFESKVYENLDNVIGETPTAAVRSFGHHAGNALVGLSQTVVNNRLSDLGMFGKDSDAYKQTEQLAGDIQRYGKERQESYDATNPSGFNLKNTLSWAGATGGVTAPFVIGPGGAAMNAPVTAVSKIPMLTKVPGFLQGSEKVARRGLAGGAQGLIAAETMPVLDGDYQDGKNFNRAVSVVGGALAPNVIQGLINTGRGAKYAYDYFANPAKIAGQKLTDWLGADDATVAALRNAPEYFPGEKITLAQANPSPKAFAIEKAFENQPEFKIAAEEMRNANNSGRLGVVDRLAGTPEEMTAALKRRKDATDPFYREKVNPVSKYTRYNNASSALDAAKGGRMSSADFDAIDRAGKIVRAVRDGRLDEDAAVAQLKGLSVASKAGQKALDQATTAMNKNMISAKTIDRALAGLTLHKNETVRAFASKQIAYLSKLKEQYGDNVPLEALQGMQQELSKSFDSAAAGTGFDKSAKFVLGQLNAKFTNLLERGAPGFRDNSRAYAKLSEPITDMEAARALQKRPDGKVLNTAGDEPLTLADVNRAIGDDGKARYGMSESASNQLLALRESLKRSGTTIRSSGSDTAYNIGADGWLAKQMYGDGKRNALAYGLPIAGGFIGNKLGGGGGLMAGTAAGTALSAGLMSKVGQINSRIAAETAAGVFDARKAADMIEKTLRENPKEAQSLLRQFPFWGALLESER